MGAYLLGCLATGYYLVRRRTGRDIREIESGSTGARNVGRILGKSGFALTVAGDAGKGALAVGAALAWTHQLPLAALAMVAVVAGHIWPVSLHWRGGKGVSTSLGALLVYDDRLALTFAVLFLAGLVLTRRSVLPAMFAFACLPAANWCLAPDGLTTALLAVLAAMVLFAHRKNCTAEMAWRLARRDVASKPEAPKL